MDRREFLEVFMQPQNKFGLLPAIVGVLAGNIFTKSIPDRLRLELFFTLIRIQRRSGVASPGEQQPAGVFADGVARMNCTPVWARCRQAWSAHEPGRS